jgi:predicted kinase
VTGKTLHMTVGLPLSGKSTHAGLLSREKGWPVVRPDAIRLALHGARFNDMAEPFVWAIAAVMVRALFLAGHDNVVMDACNHTRKRRDIWKDPAWRRSFILIDTPKEECLRRANADGDDRIAPVIERMALAWERPGDDETD